MWSTCRDAQSLAAKLFRQHNAARVGRGYRRTVPGNVAAIVRAVAARLREHLDARTGVMTSMFVDVIPEYRHDDEIRRMTVASTASNLATVVDMLARDLAIDDIAVPAAAAESARRFAQHELSLEALLRAYRLGEHMFVQWAIADIAALCPPTEVALAATSHIAILTNNYIDRVTERIIGIYETERRRWDANPGGARALRLRTVLRDQDVDLRTAEQMLGISLGGWHLAMIVWTSADAPHPTEILRGAVGAVAHAAGSVPQTAVLDGHSWWAWLSLPSKPTLDTDRLDADMRARGGARIAVGEPGCGLAGFRQTFREADAARRVALATRRPHLLTLHADTAVAGLLVDRLPEVNAWAQRILGGLMASDDSSARLRDTLLTFLDAQGSYTDAAARMHVHKNTVHYRIRKAEEILGRSVAHNRLETELALTICAQLGLDAAPR